MTTKQARLRKGKSMGKTVARKTDTRARRKAATAQRMAAEAAKVAAELKAAVKPRPSAKAARKPGGRSASSPKQT